MSNKLIIIGAQYPGLESRVDLIQTGYSLQILRQTSMPAIVLQNLSNSILEHCIQLSYVYSTHVQICSIAAPQADYID